MEGEEREGGRARRRSGRPAASSGVPPLALALFARHAERRLAAQFQAVSLARSGRPDWSAARGRPLVVYLNRVSWWDPLVCLLLAKTLLPQRSHYAPIEARRLGRDGFFESLGFFAVEPDSSRGARRFLRQSVAALAAPEATLWATAGGWASDPRERSGKAPPGLGHLVRRLRDGIVLPLALEYPFWDEPRPQALARFGEPVSVADAGMKATDWSELLAARLRAVEQRLAADAVARDPARFEVLLHGHGQAGDVWDRLKARLTRGSRPAGGAAPQKDEG